MRYISRFILATLCLLVATAPLSAQWIQIGEIPGRARYLVVSGPNLIAGSYGGLYVSSDGGATWVRASIVGRDSSVTAMTVGPNQMGGIQVLASSFGPRIFRSTDHGTTWTIVGSLPRDTWISALVVSGSYLFAGTFAGVFRSSDNGVTWSPANNGLPTTIEPPLVNCLTVSGTKLFAGTIMNGLFVSADNGTTWTQVTNGLHTGADIIKILATGTTLISAVHGAGLYRSTDSGSTWSQSNTTSGGAKLTSASDFAFYGTRMFAAQSSLGVWISVDGGKNWAPINTGLPSVTLEALAIYGTDLYTSANFYICRRPLSELTTCVENSEGTISTHPFLEQNYPNPFNPMTTISFSLPTRSFVSLMVLDALGRQVSSLVTEELPAGKYARQWNAGTLPSGVYFCRLQIAAFRETRKLLLLK